MSNPYVGEIRMFGGNFSPRGWAFCQGQLLAISQNDALFSLLGTIYGGDGVNTFALPDLRGRVPIHWGNLPGGSSYVIGQKSGTENVTLTINQIPSHNHPFQASTDNGTATSPNGQVMAQSGFNKFATTAPVAAMAANSVGQTGSNFSHDNVQPYQVVNYIIALFGIYPSRN